MKKIKINNIYCFAPPSRIELIDYALKNKSILIAVNAEKILNSPLETQNIINRNIGYPDGIGAIWALNKRGVKNAIKIPGCELWLDIIKLNYSEEKFYLVGSKEEIIQQTITKLQLDFPSIKIVGFRNGYINTDEEKHLLINDIVEKKPGIVFVAMGSPKQELIMEELSNKHKAVYQGLGGSFDLYVGNVKRAPDWWIKIFKWEGLYRSLSDFTNIKRWKRQHIIFKFMWRLWTNKL
jgi:UDP-N-acetyl-D-mannosaminouronate:lipid I N-acetyl-D-mannosaminouronosyltransferase